MKILSAKQIRDADQYTIRHEPMKGIDLMERAAGKCTEWLSDNIRASHSNLKIFCGPGNNGGDGLAIARQSLSLFDNVEVYIIRGYTIYSDDFLVNEQRLKKNKLTLHNIKSMSGFPKITKQDCIVDALFGTGLNKPVTGLASQVIDRINKSNATVVAIDMPSGLYAGTPSSPGSSIIHAAYTLSFECPKLSFLFAENYPYVGEFVMLPIGLNKKFIHDQPSMNTYLTKEEVSKLLIKRKKFDHKGTYGHALLIAGEYGKMGAAIMSSKACLRAGAGLVTTHIPKCGYEILQSAVPEVMVETDADEKYFTDSIPSGNYDATGIGPGISTKHKTAKALKKLLQKHFKPLVIDADALNILSQNKSWLKLIPQQSILTPHPKEFERLAGRAGNDFERHQLQLDFAAGNKVYVVLKGANTCISGPDGSAYFNSTGNPGMATAGSGDVLTGILTGLLAQGYSPLNACILGVYLHGLAGDIAAKQKSIYGMIAGDIIEALPQAYNELLRVQN